MEMIEGLCKVLLSGGHWLTGVRIFVFHGIIHNKQKTRIHRNFHFLDDFYSIARYIKILKPINVADFIPGEKRHGIIITFDDGYANNQILAEVLDKYKIPWTLL